MSEMTITDMQHGVARRLGRAVYHHGAMSRQGMLERLFTLAFSGLVYPQIWEDPEVDLAALRLESDSRIVTIASGGCNVLSYLTAGPERILAVDLNPSHVALTRLKLAAVEHLPGQGDFYRFFGSAREKTNVAAYDRFVRRQLDAATRRYWDRRTLSGRRRIAGFADGFYRRGLLGRFIGAAHMVAKLYGTDPAELMQARSISQQRAFFDQKLAPLFAKPLIRWATGQSVSLYGLGIPPAQYRALAGSRPMAEVLRERLERLVCDFPLQDNYFAWQAFARAYAPDGGGSLPPYLQARHYHTVKAHATRARVFNCPLTELLRTQPAASNDRYVLLDAQDWMDDARLNDLWREINRTARPGARVIFRTAAEPTLLPGRVGDAILSRWTYHETESRGFGARDRSSIYGGFHLYSLEN